MINKKEAELRNKQDELSGVKEEMGRAAKERNALLVTIREKERAAQDAKLELTRIQSQMEDLRMELVPSKETQKNAAAELEKTRALKNALEMKLQNLSMEMALIRAEKKQN